MPVTRPVAPRSRAFSRPSLPQSPLAFSNSCCTFSSSNWTQIGQNIQNPRSPLQEKHVTSAMALMHWICHHGRSQVSVYRIQWVQKMILENLIINQSFRTSWLMIFFNAASMVGRCEGNRCNGLQTENVGRWKWMQFLSICRPIAECRSYSPYQTPTSLHLPAHKTCHVIPKGG